MTEEQIKQTSKVTEFARNMVKQSNYPKDLQDHIIATCMVVVTEATQELEKELEEEKKLNAEIKARFVKCNTCTDEMKSKCLMFSENLCEGERCEELVDLMGLISKSELEKENANLKEELKKWKDEWQEQVQKATDEGYARTLQTIQLIKAKKLLKKVVTDFHNMDCVDVHIDKTIAEAEQFISEVEK